ncbi:MAG: PhzF family phenazine biosynthesis protein [Halobacteriaceae archaeon]
MADRRRTLLVDAFTQRPLTGNAAGVVPDATGLSEDQMRAIARELAVSETAFILDSETADRAVRYFTPEQEVDLCGHATIASHAYLAAENVIDPGTHTLETAVGVLEIEVTSDHVIWMTQDEPSVREIAVDVETVAEALDLPLGAVSEMELPIAVASTGLPFLVVPVTFLEPLGNAAPDMSAIADLAERFDAIGIYAFTFDALEAESTLHGRCFVPGAGVPEDPVTGTASGATGAYLKRVDAFETFPEEMRFEQGHFLDRPGTVQVQVDDRVRVGGTAVRTLDGELAVPPDETDEIIDA